MITIEQAIQAAAECLSGVGIDNPRLESEFLVAAFLHWPRTRLLLDRHQALSPDKRRDLQKWIGEREKRKPLAYVTGEQPFRDLTMGVTPDVLIPRPETELLVERALMLLEGVRENCTVVDVGTGSGNIALSLAAHSNVKRVIAMDISNRALAVARANAARYPWGQKCLWVEGDLLGPLREKVDLIAANLPYIQSSVLQSLEPELHWEPRLALDGGPDGLDLIRRLVSQAERGLKEEGILLLEIGYDQAQAVKALFMEHEAWAEAQIFCDLAGHPRIAQAKRVG